MATEESKPRVILDPRFKAGRLLVQSGQAETAITVFATLLQECRHTFDESSIETAPANYEYGNALFRAYQKQQDKLLEEREEEEKLKSKDTARQAAASAAEQRAIIVEESKPPPKESTIKPADKTKTAGENNENSQTEDNDSDAKLALELMETAWSIMDNNLSETSGTCEYKAWTEKEIPRALTGIGDVLSSLSRHADAMDAYSRGLGHWQSFLDAISDECTEETLVTRRRIVESNTLIAEELLACPPDQDVITSETKDVLVKAPDRLDFVRGYYDKARDELQESVVLMGQLAATGEDIGKEKENICFASTMVMGLGISLAELEEAESADPEPKKKKAKTT